MADNVKHWHAQIAESAESLFTLIGALNDALIHLFKQSGYLFITRKHTL